MKIATNLKQSRRLIEILPYETADMHYAFFAICGEEFQEVVDASATLLPGNKNKRFPFEYAWSLSALLENLPASLRDKEDHELILFIEKEHTDYHIGYRRNTTKFTVIDVFPCDDLVDACYELILKLRENKLI